MTLFQTISGTYIRVLPGYPKLNYEFLFAFKFIFIYLQQIQFIRLNNRKGRAEKNI